MYIHSPRQEAKACAVGRLARYLDVRVIVECIFYSINSSEGKSGSWECGDASDEISKERLVRLFNWPWRGTASL